MDSFFGCPKIIWLSGKIPSQKISGISPSANSFNIFAISFDLISGLLPEFEKALLLIVIERGCG